MTSSYWRDALYAGTCASCRCRFKRGERIVFAPRTRRCYCERETCGPRIMAPIEARALEEARRARVTLELAQRERTLYPNFDQAA